MHSALEREHSDLEPGGHEVVRLQVVLIQLGDPASLGVDVAVSDSDLSRPLVLFNRPVQHELGQF